jgi:hypothetical protein
MVMKKKNKYLIKFIYFSSFSSRYGREDLSRQAICLYLAGGAAGGSKAAGGAKAAFAMFQQKDVAAGGTGKVSRYFKKNKNKFILNKSLVNKVLVHQLTQRVSKNVFCHGVNTVLRGTKYVEYVI